MSTEILRSWMQDWGRKWGVDLEFINDGCCLQYKDDFSFAVEPVQEDESLFMLTASLVTVHNDPYTDLPLLQKAMEINRFQLETMGGTLSYVPALGSILFILSFPYGKCDPNVFGNLLMNFLDLAIQLRDKLLDNSGTTETNTRQARTKEQITGLLRV